MQMQRKSGIPRHSVGYAGGVANENAAYIYSGAGARPISGAYARGNEDNTSNETTMTDDEAGGQNLIDHIVKGGQSTK